MYKVINERIEDFVFEYNGQKFHALLCDPPYELGFFGMDWDKSGIAFKSETWKGLAEHLLPGAFGMVFASARGWHRVACAIEDAGLKIHPSIYGWIQSSGFPKATRIDTQIDKALGKLGERKVIGQQTKAIKTDSGVPLPTSGKTVYKTRKVTSPASDQARIWAGYRYGLQALKPALEPIIVFQVPYKGRPIDSIVETGAGALNINGARIPHNEKCRLMAAQTDKDVMSGHGKVQQGGRHKPTLELKPEGRWPANFYVDEEGARKLNGQNSAPNAAARFFFNVNRKLDESDPVLYMPKVSRKERDMGLDRTPIHNLHPTVKPIDLTRWLATLLLPPPEYAPRRILVPFAGSGSEMIGAILAGWDEVTGIEMDPEYCKIAEARLKHWSNRQLRLL